MRADREFVRLCAGMFLPVAQMLLGACVGWAGFFVGRSTGESFMPLAALVVGIAAAAAHGWRAPPAPACSELSLICSAGGLAVGVGCANLALVVLGSFGVGCVLFDAQTRVVRRVQRGDACGRALQMLAMVAAIVLAFGAHGSEQVARHLPLALAAASALLLVGVRLSGDAGSALSQSPSLFVRANTLGCPAVMASTAALWPLLPRDCLADTAALAVMLTLHAASALLAASAWAPPQVAVEEGQCASVNHPALAPPRRRRVAPT